MKRNQFLYTLLLACVLLNLVGLSGCSPKESQREISDVREVSKEELAPVPTLSTSERLGLRSQENPHAGGMPPNAPMGMPMPEAAPESGLTWTAPTSWRQEGDRPMRLVTFSADESGESQCYISILGGAAGGAEANFNRWRMQMGQGPLTAEDLAALPSVSILGQEAPMIRILGDYAGMGGEEKSGQLMLGVVCPLGDRTLFVKMLGPQAVMEQEVDRFKEFCGSLVAEASS